MKGLLHSETQGYRLHQTSDSTTSAYGFLDQPGKEKEELMFHTGCFQGAELRVVYIPLPDALMGTRYHLPNLIAM